MKKEVIHFVQYVLVKILFFGAAYPLQAQVSNHPHGKVLSVAMKIGLFRIRSDCRHSGIQNGIIGDIR